MSDIFDEADDTSTPLTEEEKRELIPAHITTRHDLNSAEQENIARAQEWAFSRKRNLLTERFITTLHKRMLGDVWRWAGRFRTSERNIGVDHWQIAMALRILLDDAKLWTEKKVFPSDEIAVRFHHRLVQIHPFANGNGRHARLMGDLLITQLGGERFTWGSGNLGPSGDLRERYITTLRAADNHEIGPLVAFARS